MKRIGFDISKSALGRTIGSIVLVIFIILFSMLLAPYQCNEHPNGKMTLKRYKTVFCNLWPRFKKFLREESTRNGPVVGYIKGTTKTVVENMRYKVQTLRGNLRLFLIIFTLFPNR